MKKGIVARLTPSAAKGLAFLDRSRTWLPLFLRLSVGATFVFHGYSKVFEKGAGATAGAFVEMGIPLASVLGPLVPYIEFFGGIGLIAGLGTRVWAFFQAGIMAFAIAFVHWKVGFKDWEWQALILASCLVLVLGGPGTLSIDHWIRKSAKG